MTSTNPIKIYDENNKLVNEDNPCTFPDTVAESYSERTYSIHNTSKYHLEVKQVNTDPTIEYIEFPTKMIPNEKVTFKVRYHPTFEHLKATNSAIGFEFRIL